MQVLTDIDNGRNPMHLTKDQLERAATENQFMNAKIKSIEVCVLAYERVSGRSDRDRIGPCWEVELPDAVERGASADISRPRRGDSGRRRSALTSTAWRVGRVDFGN
jgi:hypothetical protein